MRYQTVLVPCAMVLAVAGLVVTVPACGKLEETSLPSDFVNPPNPSIPPLPSGSPSPPTFGTPAPSVQPTTTPSATPSTGPTPTPAPSSTPVASCSLPSMPECGAAEGPPGVFGCCREEPDRQFASQVDQAITIFMSQRPDLFNGEQVRDGDAYVRGVAQVLVQRFGLCARQGGPPDEVAVKGSNSFNEQYDILFGSGSVRRGGYQVTCRPARF